MSSLRKVLSIVTSTLILSFTCSVSAIENPPVSPLQLESQPAPNNNYFTIVPGAQQCAHLNPELKTCFPIYNDSDVMLKVNDAKFNLKDRKLPSQKMTFMYSEKKEFDNTTVVIVNSKTQKTIYKGLVMNKVGLKCSDKACIPWD